MSNAPPPHPPDYRRDELDDLFPGKLPSVNERIRRVLRIEGILNLGAIAAEREEFFFRLPNLGERSITIMAQALAKHGLNLAPEPGPVERRSRRAARCK